MLRRFTAASALPLTTALQGLALTLLALFSYSVAPRRPRARWNRGFAEARRAQSRASSRFLATSPGSGCRYRSSPSSTSRARTSAPTPSPERPKAPIAQGEKLAALRVSSVALAGLVTMDSPTPIPDAPDVIGLQGIGGRSGRSWLGGSERTSRGNGGYMGPSDVGDEGSGWGGSGWGGIGRGRGGHGDNCVPSRGGLFRRPPAPLAVPTAGPAGGAGGAAAAAESVAKAGPPAATVPPGAVPSSKSGFDSSNGLNRSPGVWSVPAPRAHEIPENDRTSFWQENCNLQTDERKFPCGLLVS